MRIYILLTLLILFSGYIAPAQTEQIWICAQGGGYDFSGGQPVHITGSEGNGGESAASVCGDNGNLLFYTNGTSVWTTDHQLMSNGSNLTGGLTTRSTSQGSLIVPQPGNPDRYFIFSLTDPGNTSSQADLTYNGRLRYSVVDMTLNGGKGDVVNGQKNIPLAEWLDEKMIGVTGDRCNIWVVVHVKDSAVFKSFEVTESGVSAQPVISRTGTESIYRYNIRGGLNASPDRRKIISCTADGTGAEWGGMELYDFDPATGILSNPVLFDGRYQAYYHAAFSPDMSRLYAVHKGGGLISATDIFQFDLTAANPVATKTKIGTCHPFTEFKTGPDGRLYLQGLTSGGLGVIRYPDRLGLDCEFVPGIIVPPVTSSLPNNVPVIVRDTAHYTVQQNVPCFADSVLLTPTRNGWNHQWSDGATGTATRYAGAAGRYWVRYLTAPCRLVTDTFIVPQVKPALRMEYSGNECRQQQDGYIRIQPGAGDGATYTFTWKNDEGQTIRTHTPGAGSGDTLEGLGPGAYSVRVSGSNGCDTLIHFLLPEPDYEAAFETGQFVCMYDTLRISNTSTGSTLNGWHWDFGDGSTSSSRDPYHVYTRAGDYTIRLISAPCPDTAYASVTVEDAAVPEIALSDTSLCPSEELILTPFPGPGFLSLIWEIGGTTHSVADLSPLKYSFHEPGNYDVKLLAEYRACIRESAVSTVTVHPDPAVRLGPDTSVCPDAQPVRLAPESPDGTWHTFNWSTGANTGHIITGTPGDYWLAVTSEAGCTGSDTIRVLKSCYLDIPNVFSPNGDGINDYFFTPGVLSGDISSIRIRIFSRWGELLFESGNLYGKGWDGSYKGKLQAQGVYIYLVEASFLNGRQEKRQGNITLIR